MKNRNIEEKIILNSLGVLNEEEKEKLKSIIKHSDDSLKREVSNFNNLASLIPRLLNKNLSLSKNVKKKLFEKIKAKQDVDGNIKEKEFGFIYADSNDWIQHSIEGIKIKQLAFNEKSGYAMLLMKVAPGTKYPAHHHNGAEECYVIEGDVYAEGKILGPGDFHHAEGGSDHNPLYTKNGCTLILVVDPKDV
jgi:quercetin dioxygenase-like cupin family protein